MKQSNILRTTARNKIAAFSAALTVFFTTHPGYAQAAAKLSNAETALKGLQDDLKIIIPVAAAVILLCLAIGYAGRYISKDTFIRWSIGVVIAGSAAELAKLLFTGK
ncbi:VirB2 family type IV secretion system major pilin TrwL [Bartonella krasnovii]|uniref:VirB2 family type IV secretion system major pilin TrwL n=1 Tax=Bartonella krasnovii TaxID=2267275 RepID=A0ABY3W049_9HYPH|nr:VirB2 family type IV secretion system major pilin TrwL [Bartonella krasnovii]UNF29000.1 VirB2 family type IV secretion system major pilin TrwL [Bartonella krasnovii]UNF35355.1 VirB2 family type IV secretion system major pilin TrwL [Bartonella krasnovii]UNF36984.1 VirB2 family type IV secretion system major pilin TrwL [Bartonella krasnovii]UNF40398.1 VirB2 family type IV secretion system major pilin TrwL [Bartonella krasnovii]UNF48542.1 VirB2 family type IV secretion system major pilin TrwL 